jgi:hypothetical protein
MKDMVLIRYIIDTSDVLPDKKQEANKYLAKLETAVRQHIQSDEAYWLCKSCGQRNDIEIKKSIIGKIKTL